MHRETIPKLNWPSAGVQAEWGLLSRCLEDPSYLSVYNRDEQVRVLEYAIGHGAGPLLYYRLKASSALGGLTDNLAGELRQIYRSTSAANLLLSGQIPPLVRRFKEEDIPVLCVKGIFLAETVYKNLGLRPACDIDLIVRPEDANRGIQLLKELGYGKIFPVPGDFDPEISHARFCQRPNKTGFPVDLHHVLVKDDLGGSPQATEWFWGHTVSVAINDCEVRTLRAEANILYLCSHLANHHPWEPRFIWLYDVHAILEGSNSAFDWELFLKLSQRLQCGASAYHVLRATQAFLHTPVPNSVLVELAGASQSSPPLNLQRKLPSTRATKTFLDWWAIPDIKIRLRFLWHMFFPTRTYMIDRYQPSHPQVWPLLYPYRWGIMLGDIIRTIGMLLQQRKS